MGSFLICDICTSVGEILEGILSGGVPQGVWPCPRKSWVTYLTMKILRTITAFAFAAQAAALSIGGKHMTVERDSDGLQDIVSNLKLYVHSM